MGRKRTALYRCMVPCKSNNYVMHDTMDSNTIDDMDICLSPGKALVAKNWKSARVRTGITQNSVRDQESARHQEP